MSNNNEWQARLKAAWLGLLAAIQPALVWLRQNWRPLLLRARRQFLTWFGDLKYYKFPLFLIWDPGAYRVNGEDMREVISEIKPGDIVLRAYDNYVDGLFIPGNTKGKSKHKFSHAGVFFGQVNEILRAQVGSQLVGDAKKSAEQQRKFAQEQLFKPGPQQVVHAMAEGVKMEDILQFCRCDYMMILRLPDQIEKKVGYIADPFPLAKLFPEEEEIRRRLDAGESVGRNEVIPCIQEVALAWLGEEYDFGFKFDDGSEKHHTFSCSEFAYWCYRSVDRHIGLTPKLVKYGLLQKMAILPDDLMHTSLQIVWRSRSLR